MEAYLKDYLKSDNNKVLLVAKARQIGKSYIIRKVGKVLFDNFIELNMVTDKLVTKGNYNIKKGIVLSNEKRIIKKTILFIYQPTILCS